MIIIVMHVGVILQYTNFCRCFFRYIFVRASKRLCMFGYVRDTYTHKSCMDRMDSQFCITF